MEKGEMKRKRGREAGSVSALSPHLRYSEGLSPEPFLLRSLSPKLDRLARPSSLTHTHTRPPAPFPPSLPQSPPLSSGARTLCTYPFRPGPGLSSSSKPPAARNFTRTLPGEQVRGSRLHSLSHRTGMISTLLGTCSFPRVLPSGGIYLTAAANRRQSRRRTGGNGSRFRPNTMCPQREGYRWSFLLLPLVRSRRPDYRPSRCRWRRLRQGKSGFRGEGLSRGEEEEESLIKDVQRNCVKARM